MPPSALTLLLSRMRAFQTTLEKLPLAQKTEHVTQPLAENFNAILNDIKTACPDIAAQLPQPLLRRGGLLAKHGMVQERYIDLEIMVAQTLELLTHLQPES